MNAIKVIATVAIALVMSGCATLTEDPMTPVTLTFSNGDIGKCDLTNKRGKWRVLVPGTASVRKSDDALKYYCYTTGYKKTARGEIPSEMGGKIVASAIFLDFGIVDSMTDMHRRYPSSFVIPVR